MKDMEVGTCDSKKQRGSMGAKLLEPKARRRNGTGLEVHIDEESQLEGLQSVQFVG